MTGACASATADMRLDAPLVGRTVLMQQSEEADLLLAFKFCGLTLGCGFLLKHPSNVKAERGDYLDS